MAFFCAFNVDNTGGKNGPDALDADGAGANFSNDEAFIHFFTRDGDEDALKYLGALFVAFFHLLVNGERITDVEVFLFVV